MLKLSKMFENTNFIPFIPLIPPCSYQGGKQRLAKQIVSYIQDNSNLKDSKFYDLCCGSGAISLEIENRHLNVDITMVDASPWGLFYKEIGDKSFNLNEFKIFIDSIPKDITKIKGYAENIISLPVDIKNMIYHFLFLQSCAFGSSATWIEGNSWKKSGGLRDFWLPTKTSNRKSPVNPMMPMPDTLYERCEDILKYSNNITGVYGKVENMDICNNSIIYIDPPYKGRSGYGYSFDYDSFLSKIRNLNVDVYISEGYAMKNATKIELLTNGRLKGNMNGNTIGSPVNEYLNFFKFGGKDNVMITNLKNN